MIKRKGILTIAICVAVVAVAATTIGAASASANTVAIGSSDGADITEETTVLVNTDQPIVGDIALDSTFIGKIEPEQELMVFPKAAGEVLTTYYKVGDVVKAGDVLCELDSTTLRTTIAQSQATVAAAQARADYNLAMAEKDLETHDFNVDKGYDANLIAAETAVKNAETGVEKATVALTTATRTLRDHREKDEYDYESADQYESLMDQYRDAVVTAELGVETARLGLETAEENLRSAKMMTQEKRVSANDGVEMARLNTDLTDQQLAIKKLEDSLKDYVITAAIDGVVEQVNVDPHDMASPQSAVYVISNKESMMVSFNVSASATQSLKYGDITTVEIGGNTYTGTVIEIGTKVNSVGLFPVKLRINDDDSSLMTGLTVTVTATTQHTQDAVLLPLKYIYFKDNISYVYVMENNIAVKTPIEIGIMNDEYVEVLSGLKSTTDVISTWSPDLVDGAVVEVANGEADEF